MDALSRNTNISDQRVLDNIEQENEPSTTDGREDIGPVWPWDKLPPVIHSHCAKLDCPIYCCPTDPEIRVLSSQGVLGKSEGECLIWFG